jgi:carbon monoxide dehydrogenase subunit G
VPAGSVEITIGRSADDVWARIGDFGDMSWFPGVERVTVEGDERACTMAGRDLVHVERLVRRDEVARTYTYATLYFRGATVVPTDDGGTFDVNSISGHEGTITVTPLGATSARVTYDFAVDDDAMAENMRERYAGVLGVLRSELER